MTVAGDWGGRWRTMAYRRDWAKAGMGVDGKWMMESVPKFRPPVISSHDSVLGGTGWTSEGS